MLQSISNFEFLKLLTEISQPFDFQKLYDETFVDIY